MLLLDLHHLHTKNKIKQLIYILNYKLISCLLMIIIFKLTIEVRKLGSVFHKICVVMKNLMMMNELDIKLYILFFFYYFYILINTTLGNHIYV